MCTRKSRPLYTTINYLFYINTKSCLQRKIHLSIKICWLNVITCYFQFQRIQILDIDLFSIYSSIVENPVYYCFPEKWVLSSLKLEKRKCEFSTIDLFDLTKKRWCRVDKAFSQTWEKAFLKARKSYTQDHEQFCRKVSHFFKNDESFDYLLILYWNILDRNSNFFQHAIFEIGNLLKELYQNSLFLAFWTLWAEIYILILKGPFHNRRTIKSDSSRDNKSPTFSKKSYSCL